MTEATMTFPAKIMRVSNALYQVDWNTRTAKDAISDIIRYFAELNEDGNFKLTEDQRKAYLEDVRTMIAELRTVESGLKVSSQ